jgi:hypothetical protein
MTDKNNPDALWLMLGEIRGDLRWLVEDRLKASRRMDDIEADFTEKLEEHDERLGKLENFKVRVGVIIAGATAVIGLFAGAFADRVIKTFSAITGG